MAKDMEFQPKMKRKNFRIFEQFYVIGCNEEELDLFEPVLDDLDRESDSEKGNQVVPCVSPALVYQYPEKAEMDQVKKRADVIKDFAFPNGIKPKLMKLDSEADKEETKSSLVTLMLEIQKNRKNSFVFTLDSRNECMEDGVDNYFNCLCIKFETLARRKTDGAIFLVEQAFCMLSQNSLLQIKFEAMDRLLQVINSNQKFFYFREQSTIDHLVGSFFSVDLKSDETYCSIQDLYEQGRVSFEEDKVPKYVEIDVDVRIGNGQPEEQYSIPLNCRVPMSFQEIALSNFKWHCSVLFSLFYDFRIIMKLVTAVFLERSIIFISKNPAKLSAVILGLKSMIRPFTWCHSLIPVLPCSLLGVLDTPTPILAGITLETYESMLSEYEIDSDFKESRTWVKLDDLKGINRASKFARFSSIEMKGIEWCLGDEQIPFQEYNWYREYAGCQELSDLHQSFLKQSNSPYENQAESESINSSSEELFFQLSEKQTLTLQTIYDRYTQMITAQILSMINIPKLKAI